MTKQAAEPDPSNNGNLFGMTPQGSNGERLDRVLAQLFSSFSRNLLQKWIKEGRALVDSQVEKNIRKKVFTGQSLEISIPKLVPGQSKKAENIPLDVAYEDQNLIVINKPADFVMHPGSGVHHGTLMHALLFHYPELALLERAGIVHRLDKDTTGLVVIARTFEAHHFLVQKIKERIVSRHYLAVTHGRIHPLKGKVDLNIGRHPKNRIKMAVREVGGKTAITHYQTLELFDEHSLIACQLETGRTHQIRVHFQHKGHPLAGDTTYGLINKNKSIEHIISRQALHAHKLSLPDPKTGKILSWESSPPKDFETLIAFLQKKQASFLS